MTDQWCSDDEQLFTHLGDALRTAADVPDRFIELGKGAFAWRGIDTELAELAYDSAVAAGAATAAGARGDQTPTRALTFTTSQLTIEIEATADALRGQLVPPQPGEIALRSVQGSMATVTVDEIGWFVLAPLPACPFQLLVRTGTGSPVLTGWIAL